IGGALGIAQSLDVGNFAAEEAAVVLLDQMLAVYGAIPRAANKSLEDILVKAIAATAVHEAGHLLGMQHTLNTNMAAQLNDTGGVPNGRVGLGPDGVFGTPDDFNPQFGIDTYDP